MKRTRTELLRLLEPGLGPEAATALLEELETVDPDRLATKQDLAELRSATKQDLAELRSATKQDLAELRSATKQDLAELRSATKQDLAATEASLREDLARVGHRFELVDQRFETVGVQITSAKNEVITEVRDRIDDAIHAQVKTILFSMAGIVVSLYGFAFAVLRFG